MTLKSRIDTKEGNIDRERIATDVRLIFDEYFCPICDCLLWKPRSCGSCQQLFCRKCIQTWLSRNATSCPFRCEPYEDRRAPPHMQSMLARLLIHCRNAPLGCSQVLSYDLLEQHENVECQFSTQRCHICEELVLVGLVNRHQKLCRPTVVRCSLCQCAVEPTLLQSHYAVCPGQNVNQFQGQTIDDTIAVPQPTTDNWLVTQINKAMEARFRQPTINIPGIQQIFQARQGGPLATMLATLILILRNLKKASFILLVLFCSGVVTTMGICMVIPMILQRCTNASVHKAFTLIIAFSGLLSFGALYLLQWMTDTTIIIFLSIGLVLMGAANNYIKPDLLQTVLTQTQTGMLYIAVFVIFKIGFLFVRFYFFSVPPYITATCLAWIASFLTFHIRRFCIHA